MSVVLPLLQAILALGSSPPLSPDIPTLHFEPMSSKTMSIKQVAPDNNENLIPEQVLECLKKPMSQSTMAQVKQHNSFGVGRDRLIQALDTLRYSPTLPSRQQFLIS